MSRARVNLLSTGHPHFDIRYRLDKGENLHRNYRVSEGSNAVHPTGNPMRYSSNSGASEPFVFVGPTARPRREFTGTFEQSPVSLWSRAVGVGQRTASARFRPHIPLGEIRYVPSVFLCPETSVVLGVGQEKAPLSEVRGTDASSWKYERPAGVTFTLQVRKTVVEFHIDEPSNILSKHPSGPELRHDPAHLRPEETVVLRAPSLPGFRDRLAGEATGQKGRASDAGVPKRSSCNAADVVESRYARPVSGQDSSAVCVTFHLCYRFKTGRFGREVDAANSCEKGNVGKTHTGSLDCESVIRPAARQSLSIR